MEFGRANGQAGAWRSQGGAQHYVRQSQDLADWDRSICASQSDPTLVHNLLQIMKNTLSLFTASLLLCGSGVAQTVSQPLPSTVVVTPGTVKTTEVTTTPSGRRLERSMVRQQLSIAPKAVAVPEIPVQPAGAAVTERTTTTTTGPATRVYSPDRNVVVVRTETQTQELPYVALPVLFVKDTDELLDQESLAALEETAAAIKEVALQEPAAVFDIEGHTSTEGTDEHNMQLSAARAQRVYDELTRTYGVPTRVFSAHGYGENYARYPDAPEEQLQLDRRVLVVRTK